MLREHYAVGRLSTDELTQRVAAAQTAVTWDDLYRIFGDLPVIPGMEIGPPPRYPVVAPPVPPVPPPANVYVVPPPPVVVATHDPGSGARTAAWVFFVLGFFTCGLAWIPAVVLAIVAAASGRRTVTAYPPGGGQARPGTRVHGGRSGMVVACVVGVIVLMALVGVVTNMNTKHEVVVVVSSFETSSFAGDTFVHTKNATAAETDVALPYDQSFTVRGSLSTVTVSADNGYFGKKKKKPSLTCRIIVDGRIVAESTDDGRCYASYSGTP